MSGRQDDDMRLWQFGSHQFRLDGSDVNIIKTVYSACINDGISPEDLANAPNLPSFP